MEQNNPDLEYFKQGTFTMKPVYMKKSNVIKMEISLPKPLPFQVWDVFCMRLTKLTRCSVDLHITAEKAEAVGGIQLYRTLCLPAYAAENIS